RGLDFGKSPGGLAAGGGFSYGEMARSFPMLMRSKLFVPGTRPELFEKAEKSAADSLSFDLEDSVTQDRKDEARENLKRHLAARAANGKVVLVRVNAADSPHFGRDVEAMAGADIINLPMAEEAG